MAGGAAVSVVGTVKTKSSFVRAEEDDRGAAPRVAAPRTDPRARIAPRVLRRRGGGRPSTATATTCGACCASPPASSPVSVSTPTPRGPVGEAIADGIGVVVGRLVFLVPPALLIIGGLLVRGPRERRRAAIGQADPRRGLRAALRPRACCTCSATSRLGMQVAGADRCRRLPRCRGRWIAATGARRVGERVRAARRARDRLGLAHRHDRAHRRRPSGHRRRVRSGAWFSGSVRGSVPGRHPGTERTTTIDLRDESAEEPKKRRRRKGAKDETDGTDEAVPLIDEPAVVIAGSELFDQGEPAVERRRAAADRELQADAEQRRLRSPGRGRRRRPGRRRAARHRSRPRGRAAGVEAPGPQAARSQRGARGRSSAGRGEGPRPRERAGRARRRDPTRRHGRRPDGHPLRARARPGREGRARHQPAQGHRLRHGVARRAHPGAHPRSSGHRRRGAERQAPGRRARRHPRRRRKRARPSTRSRSRSVATSTAAP